MKRVFKSADLWKYCNILWRNFRKLNSNQNKAGQSCIMSLSSNLGPYFYAHRTQLFSTLINISEAPLLMWISFNLVAVLIFLVEILSVKFKKRVKRNEIDKDMVVKFESVQIWSRGLKICIQCFWLSLFIFLSIFCQPSSDSELTDSSFCLPFLPFILSKSSDTFTRRTHEMALIIYYWFILYFFPHEPSRQYCNISDHFGKCQESQTISLCTREP